MKRLIVMLVMWLALGATAHAAAISTYGAQGVACGSGTSCNNLNVPTAAVPNQAILVCINTSGGTSAATGLGVTINGVSLTQWGSTVTQGKSVKGCFHKTIANGDAGLAIDTSWTNANNPTITAWMISPSDNVAPTFETPVGTGCASAGSCTPTTVTPSQNGDLIFESCNLSAGSPEWNGSLISPFPTIRTAADISGFFGWSGTSGSPTMASANLTSGGPYDIACIAGAVKASGTGSVIVGAGADSYNSGAALSVSPGEPSNLHSGDWALTGIDTQSGTNIVAPIDANLNTTANAHPGSANHIALTIPAGAVIGQLMISAYSCNSSGATITAPSTGGAWTSVCSDNTNGTLAVFSKVVQAGDAGTSRTWNSSATNFSNLSLLIFGSQSGITPSIEASICTHKAAATSVALPGVTSLTANDIIAGGAFQVSAASVLAASTATQLVQIGGGGYVDEYFPQAMAGASLTPSFTNGSSVAWDLWQVAIATTGTGFWTQQGTSVTDPTNAATLSVYRRAFSASDPSTWTWWLNPGGANKATFSEGLIVGAGNLNTTTPVDVSNSLVNAGEAQTQEAPLNPTPNDELALSFNGYNTGPSGERGGQYPQAITIGSHMSAYYTTPNAAVVAQAVDSVGAPYASITLGLKAASTPARTTANVDINQQVIEIFSTTAPSPPASTGAWFF